MVDNRKWFSWLTSTDEGPLFDGVFSAFFSNAGGDWGWGMARAGGGGRLGRPLFSAVWWLAKSMPGGDWPPSRSSWFSLGVPRSVGLSANGFEYSGGSGGVKKDREGGEYEGGKLLLSALPGLLMLLPPPPPVVIWLGLGRGRERECEITVIRRGVVVFVAVVVQ